MIELINMIYMNLYSQRQGEQTNDSVYDYQLSKKVRQGLFNIIKNANEARFANSPNYLMGHVRDFCENHLFDSISDRAANAFSSGYEYYNHQLRDDLREWFFMTKAEYILDFFEVVIIRMRKLQSHTETDKTIIAVNNLFVREKVGYEIVNDQIIPKSNEFLHQEVVKKTIITFNEYGFEKAEKDFVDALDALAKSDYDGAITMANTSFESTMKKILNRSNGDAKILVDDLITKGIIPKYLRNKMLAVTVIRHEESNSHGRLEDTKCTKELAEYAIHCAGANIVFLLKTINRKARA